MKNWCSDENEAMRGYIIRAVELANESGIANISDDELNAILKKLYRATDDMTADEAQAYYYNSKF